MYYRAITDCTLAVKSDDAEGQLFEIRKLHRDVNPSLISKSVDDKITKLSTE